MLSCVQAEKVCSPHLHPVNHLDDLRKGERKSTPPPQRGWPRGYVSLFPASALVKAANISLVMTQISHCRKVLKEKIQNEKRTSINYEE